MKINQFNLNKDQQSPLKASMMIYDPIKKIHLEIKYFEKHDGSNWFGYPSSTWVNPQGEKKYKWLAFFDKEEKEEFEKRLKPLVTQRYQEELKKKPSSSYSNDDEIPF